MSSTATASDKVQVDYKAEREEILRRSKADIAQVLQTMATIYSRSGGAVFQHKEVEDIATAWKESFASGEGCNQTK